VILGLDSLLDETGGIIASGLVGTTGLTPSLSLERKGT
jgi:hypothetical protein